MTSYVMEAKENLSADLIAIVAAEIEAGMGVTTDIAISQQNLGLSYDRENKTLVFSGCVVDPSGGPFTNTTGHRLWSGVNGINAGATYDGYNARNFSILTRPLSGDTVTRFDAYDPASTVPNGIGGSDGTARRFVESDESTPQLFKLVDPRTRNVWSHHTSTLGARSCFIYEFRFSESYQQTISPYVPNADRHLELGGITDDWVVIGDFQKYANGYAWQFLPRVRQADETTADYLLSYGELDEPEPLASATQRRCFDSDGNMWTACYTTSGAKDFRLYKMTMPPAVVNPATVGAITNATPWGGSDGPNTGASGYQGATGLANALGLYYLPDQSRLVYVNKLYPADKTSGSTHDPVDFHMNATYVALPGLTYAHHADIVTGYMDADWNSVGSIPTTGYAVVDYWEADQADLPYHSYTFSNATYAQRWYAFAVIPIVGGVLQGTYPVPPLTNGQAISSATHVVLARYDFSAAPALVAFAGLDFIDENGWVSAYPTYAAALSGAGVGTSVVRESFLDRAFNLEYYDMGLFDEDTSSWWFSGQAASNLPSGNFWYFDAAFTERHSYLDGQPFLRLTLDSTPVSHAKRAFVWSRIGRPTL